MNWRLERDGAPPLHLNPQNGWHIRGADFGFPTVRQVVDDRPNADGTDDRSRFFSSRVLTLDLLARGDRMAKIDELSPFLVPSARSFLYFPGPDGTERRMLLRGRDRRSELVQKTGKQAIIAQWEVPNGTSETADTAQTIAFASVGVTPGFTFDLTFDLVFPAASPAGRTNVPTIGNTRCYPVIRLWGPCTFPRVDNLQDPAEDGTPKQLAFDITLTASQFLEVDTRERTVLFNGLPGQSRYATLSFPESRWWTLAAGNNFVRYFPDSFSGNARAEFIYRCTFL